MKKILFFVGFLLFAFSISAQSINGQKISKIPIKTTVDTTDWMLLMEPEKGTLKKTTRGSVSPIYAGDGTYTPTWAETANLDIDPTGTAYYQRIGKSVEVWGSVTINPTDESVNTQFTMTLPVASALTTVSQVSGFAVNDSLGKVPIRIFSDVTGDRAYFKYVPAAADTTSKVYSFLFKYIIL